jgi:hypothetical protein
MPCGADRFFWRSPSWSSVLAGWIATHAVLFRHYTKSKRSLTSEPSCDHLFPYYADRCRWECRESSQCSR